MITIVNVSHEGAPLFGDNQYELRVNSEVICEFEHKRGFNGLAQCLRAAADAVEADRNDRVADMLNFILE